MRKIEGEKGAQLHWREKFRVDRLGLPAESAPCAAGVTEASGSELVFASGG